MRQTDPSLYEEVTSFRSVEETLNRCLCMLLAVSVTLAGQAVAANFQGNFSLLGVASLVQLS